MTKSPGIRVIFFGNERLAQGLGQITPQCLPALIDNGYEVVALVSNNDSLNSARPREFEVETVARQHGIPILTGPLKQLASQIAALRPDVGVLVAYGRIVPDQIIDLFPHGIINIHPSLLPLYRGPTPIETALLDGTPKSGVSIMRLATEMDAGPIYQQKTVHLDSQQSKATLAETLQELGTTLLLNCLPGIIDGSLKSRSQPHPDRTTYSTKIEKADGQIDWTKSANVIERQIRAYAGWPGSFTTLAGKDVIITSARVGQSMTKTPGSAVVSEKQLVMACGDNETLIIDRLKPAGKRDMTGLEFLAGNSL